MLPLKRGRGGALRMAFNCTPRLSDMHLADALVLYVYLYQLDRQRNQTLAQYIKHTDLLKPRNEK